MSTRSISSSSWSNGARFDELIIATVKRIGPIHTAGFDCLEHRCVRFPEGFRDLRNSWAPSKFVCQLLDLMSYLEVELLNSARSAY